MASLSGSLPRPGFRQSAQTRSPKPSGASTRSEARGVLREVVRGSAGRGRGQRARANFLLALAALPARGGGQLAEFALTADRSCELELANTALITTLRFVSYLAHKTTSL